MDSPNPQKRAGLEVGIFRVPYTGRDAGICDDLKEARYHARFASVHAAFIHVIATNYDDLSSAAGFYQTVIDAMAPVCCTSEKQPLALNYRAVIEGDEAGAPTGLAERWPIAVGWRNLYLSLHEISAPVMALTGEFSIVADGLVRMNGLTAPNAHEAGIKLLERSLRIIGERAGPDFDPASIEREWPRIRERLLRLELPDVELIDAATLREGILATERRNRLASFEVGVRTEQNLRMPATIVSAPPVAEMSNRVRDPITKQQAAELVSVSVGAMTNRMSKENAPDAAFGGEGKPKVWSFAVLAPWLRERWPGMTYRMENYEIAKQNFAATG